MSYLSNLGAAAGIVLAATLAVPAQAAPMSPMGSTTIKQSMADAPGSPIQVRRGGGWGGGGPRWHGRGWGGGGQRWAGGGWRGGPGWRGGGWRGGGWGPRYGYWGGPRYYNNWAWGVPLGLGIGAAIASQPYYNNSNCGWVNTRTWINGRRVWARQWQCW